MCSLCSAATTTAESAQESARKKRANRTQQATPTFILSRHCCRHAHAHKSQEGYAWICHSMYPAQPSEVELRASIGGPLVKQPYSAALLNISAMSYGALSDNAILALSRWEVSRDTGSASGREVFAQPHPLLHCVSFLVAPVSPLQSSCYLDTGSIGEFARGGLGAACRCIDT